MKHFFYQVVFLLVILLGTSCASFKQKGWLSDHQIAIAQATKNPNFNAEQKLDIVLNHYATMMEQGLKFTDPRKGVRYINRFQAQNEGNINQILDETNTWLTNMTTEQTLLLLLSVPSKPEIKRFWVVGEKFYKKYEFYKDVLSFASKIGNVFGKIGKGMFKF